MIFAAIAAFALLAPDAPQLESQRIAGFRVVEFSADEVTLEWNTPPVHPDSPPTYVYQLRYRSGGPNDTIDALTFDDPDEVGNLGGDIHFGDAPPGAGHVEHATFPFTPPLSGALGDIFHHFAVRVFNHALNPISNPDRPGPISTARASLDVTAPAVAGGFGFVSATSSSIKVTWNAPGDDALAEGPAQLYEMVYSETTPGADLAAWWNAAEPYGMLPVPGNPGDSEEALVIPLVSDTRYYFAIRALDEAMNPSPISPVIQGRTLMAPAPAAESPSTDGNESTCSAAAGASARLLGIALLVLCGAAVPVIRS